MSGQKLPSKCATTLGLFLALAAVAAPVASATVSVSRAEVSAGELRLEGTAVASRTITVDGVAMGTSDGGGEFRIERAFVSPLDCTVDVNDGSASATSARLSGCTVSSAPATASLSSLGLSPTSVVSGSSSTGTVTLTAAAPSGGLSVALSSSNASVASVPASVTVAAGATTARFTVTTGAVATTSSATITAASAGVSRSAALTVTPQTTTTPPPPPAAPTPASLTLSPSTVREGETSTGTVTLTGPAPTGGVEVALTSGNTFAATVPASTTVPAGASSATFPIVARATTSTSSSVITAAAGGVERTALFTVNTNSPTVNVLSVTPLSVTGGSNATGTVSLTAPATAGGVTVALESNSPSATVPASVTVPAGAETQSFTVATSAVTATTSALLSATHGTTTKSVSLGVTPAAVGPPVSAVTLSSSTVVGGTSVTGTVTLASAAPQGGSSVVLTSDNTNAATVPPSVTVPAGATRATFPVTTKPVTNSISSTIVAEAGGARRGATITVTSQFNADNGSLSLARGGSGEGRITSSPAGIDCTFTATGTTGRCGNAFFRAGTAVRLTARPASNSRFLGWESENSCRNAPNVTILAGVAHICRPVFGRR